MDRGPILRLLYFILFTMLYLYNTGEILGIVGYEYALMQCLNFIEGARKCFQPKLRYNISALWTGGAGYFNTRSPLFKTRP